MQGTLLGGGSMDDLSAQELAAFAGASKDPLQQPRPEYDLGVPTGRPDEVVWGARAPESAGEMAAWAARLQEKGIARLLCLLSDDEMAARASDGTSVLRNLFLETTGKANSRWGSRQLHKTVNSASKAGAPAPAAVPMNQLMDDFVNGSTANYIEDLERRYVEDPESVPGSWADFFRRLESGESPDSLSQAYSQYASTSIAATSASSALALQKSIGVTLLIRAYQTQGHLLAKLDPLELDVRPMQQDLDPAAYGFTEQDWDLEMSVDNPEFAGLFDPKDGKSTYTLREIVNRLRNVYCQSIGYEYNYISDKERCDWLRTTSRASHTSSPSRRRPWCSTGSLGA